MKPARRGMGFTARSVLWVTTASWSRPRWCQRDRASGSRPTGAQQSSQCHGVAPVGVPDAVHEAVRDVVRARTAASEDLRRKRQQLLSFLLRHGRIYRGRKHWTKMHLYWLAQQKFDHPAQQIVFQDAVDAIEDAATRLRRLDQQVAEIVPSWSMAPVVEAYQAMRGVSFGVAVTFVAEIGDLRRFDNPRQLMAFLGLVPS